MSPQLLLERRPWIIDNKYKYITLPSIVSGRICVWLYVQSVSMDRYGYVSNNYYGHAMGGQARAIAGNGGCCPSTKYQYRQTQMPVTQPPFGCNYRGNGQPVVMTQPMPDPRMMIFSQEGREWTTGICGCFEHCSSCTWTLMLLISLTFPSRLTFQTPNFCRPRPNVPGRRLENCDTMMMMKLPILPSAEKLES